MSEKLRKRSEKPNPKSTSQLANKTANNPSSTANMAESSPNVTLPTDLENLRSALRADLKETVTTLLDSALAPVNKSLSELKPH